MPKAKAHLATELGLLPPGIIALYFLGEATGFTSAKPIFILSFTGGYLFSSLFLSPDLDLKSCACRRRWGSLGFIWNPYSKLFNHRGLSHNPILGTATRLIYISPLLIPALFLIGRFLPQLTTIWAEYPQDLALTSALGLHLPNWIHIILDRLF